MELYKWTKTLQTYALQHHERWRIMEPDEELIALANDFVIKVGAAQQPDAGLITKKEKNLVKVRLVKEMRGFVQGYIARNPRVTEADKLAMGLSVYDTTPTQILDPTGQAQVVITFPARTQLMVKIVPVEGTQTDPKAYYGTRIYYGVYAAGETPPVSGMDLRHSLFTRRKRELFTFLPTDTGKTAYFAVRYENSKGKAGPWGAMESAVIP